MEPISSRVEDNGETTVFTVTGDVDAEQVIAAIIQFLRTAPTPLVIWDLSNGSLRKMSSSDLRMIVDRAAPYTGARTGGRTAIVCHNDLDFGLSRMFETFASLMEIPFEIRVFRDREHARAWLDRKL